MWIARALVGPQTGLDIHTAVAFCSGKGSGLAGWHESVFNGIQESFLRNFTAERAAGDLSDTIVSGACSQWWELPW